jgi:predicted ATPase/class 3 adenylate cyclase
VTADTVRPVEDGARPPEGTIALLFTDIEGSTRLAEALGPDWAAVLADHHALVGGAIAAERGFVDGTEGDAFFATFADAAAAARAAAAALRALLSHTWPDVVGELKVRMGLHVGYVERAGTGYVGLEVHRAARVAAAARGGQLLMTATARGLVGDVVPTESVGIHRLKDFPAPEQLFCAVVEGRGAAYFPPPRAEEVRPTNLPAGVPTLVGRDEDLERVRRALLLDGERIVTLSGRGGAGKTSLALVAAASLLDAHPGGVWLVRLADVTDRDGLLSAMAASAGAELNVDSSPLQELTNRLRDRGPTLLVLDNMEHLGAAGEAITELLDALPELRLLLTSQTPLRLAAERVLSLDALDDEASLALIERVAARRAAGFSVDRAGREPLLELVHLLDGLPLALELAAARLALLTPTQLIDRLHASADVLRDDRADRPERHRSLRATVDWTLGLLDEDGRALFVRLGAFAGPVELDEIEAVTGGDGLDVLSALATLVDVALVRRVESGDGRIRFGLPEALRQIASGLLDAAPDGDSWRRAHALRQYEIAWAARLLLVTNAVYEAAIRGDQEIAAARRWATEADPPLGEALAAARGVLLADNGKLREAFAVLEPLINAPPEDPVVYGQALWGDCWALIASGRIDEAKTVGDRAVEAAGTDEVNRCGALNMRSLAHTFGGEPDQGIRDIEEAATVAAHLGRAGLCGVVMLQAQAYLFGGDIERAAELRAEAERIGEPADAQFLWRCHTVDGDIALFSGRPADALEHYARSLEEADLRGNQIQILFDVLGVAGALGGIGEDEAAVEVSGIADRQIEEIGAREGSLIYHLGYDDFATAQERLGPEATAEHKARGAAVPAAGRVARACELARAHQPTRNS